MAGGNHLYPHETGTGCVTRLQSASVGVTGSISTLGEICETIDVMPRITMANVVPTAREAEATRNLHGRTMNGARDQYSYGLTISIDLVQSVESSLGATAAIPVAPR